MRRSCVGIAALVIVCFACGSARADEELDRLKADYQKAMRAWMEKVGELRETNSDAAAFAKAPPMPSKEYLPKFKAYAKGHEKKPEAAEALLEVLQLAGSSGGLSLFGMSNRDANWAVRRLTRDHAADASMAESIGRVGQVSWMVDRATLRKFYDAVVEKNPSREAKASAKLGLALQRGTLNPMQSGEVSTEDRAAALAMFRELLKDYADTDAAKSADAYVFELEKLQVGMKAPEVEGEDVDGHVIKLSQFHGQVVVLDFWGFW